MMETRPSQILIVPGMYMLTTGKEHIKAGKTHRQIHSHICLIHAYLLDALTFSPKKSFPPWQ